MLPDRNSDPALYGDDPGHPLPYLEALDMVAARRTGGADLVMTVEGPMQGDERSKRRLWWKLGNYLRFIMSSDYENEFGPADPATTRVVVHIDPRSDPDVFEMLRRCEDWALRNRTTLLVERSPTA